MDWYFKPNLLARILIGLATGAVTGIVLGFFSEAIKSLVDNSKFFGDLFIGFLKMIVVPMILFSPIAGAANIVPSRLGRDHVQDRRRDHAIRADRRLRIDRDGLRPAGRRQGHDHRLRLPLFQRDPPRHAGAIMVLESIGLKVEVGTAIAAAYAMILGIDALLYTGRTCLKVTGDIVGSAIVSKSGKELDLAKWA